MYVLSMLRSNVQALGFLVATAMGCRAAPSPRSSVTVSAPAKVVAATSDSRNTSRQATAIALSAEIVRRLGEFGFPVNAEQLSVVVARKERFNQGLVRNAAHFEVPGLFDALAAVARLLGMREGREPNTLKALAYQALSGAILAYYDHVEKSLLIRDDAEVRMMNLESLVAHELAHAYQDQRQGGLETFIRSNRSSVDSLRAAHGVLEGQAVVIGTGVEWLQRGVSVDRFDPEIADSSVGRLSSGEAFSIIYEAGRRFVLTRYRDGGWASVADAFAHPPTSTEQLLHPEKFRKDLPSVVTLPEIPKLMEPYPVVFESTVGELILYNRLLLIARDLNQARLGAAGWDGDRLRVQQLPDGGYALAWRVLWDRPGDAQQFETVLTRALRERAWVSLRRRGRVTDLVYAESRAHFASLSKSMAAHPANFAAVPFDAASTAAVESAWAEAEELRPHVDGDRWVLPEYGLSFKIPKHFVAMTLRGVDLLVSAPQPVFTNNINLVYEQDFFDGDVARYIEEAKRQMALTSQKWISDTTVSVGKSQAAIIEIEIPSGPRMVSIAMLVVPRQGKWVTITCAVLKKNPGQAMAILGEIIQTLRFE